MSGPMSGRDFVGTLPSTPTDGQEVRWYELDPGLTGDEADAVYVYEWRAQFKVLHEQEGMWLVFQPKGLTPKAAVRANIGVNSASPIRARIAHRIGAPASEWAGYWNPWPGISWRYVYLSREEAVAEGERVIDAEIEQRTLMIERLRAARLALRPEPKGELWPPVSP